MTITNRGSVSLAVALPVVATMQSQLSVAVSAALTKLQADLKGALAVQVALTVGAPTVTLQAEITAALETVAKLQAKLAAGITVPSASLQLGAVGVLVAAIGAQVAALELILSFSAELSGLLSANIEFLVFEGFVADFAAELAVALSGAANVEVKVPILIGASVEAKGALGTVLGV